MKTILLLGLSLASLAYATPTNGALLVTEFMPNPGGADNVDASEWIEFYNSGSVAVDLTGYKIGDEETKGAIPAEGMFSFPSGWLMPAGAVYVVAVDAFLFENTWGFKPTFETTEADDTVPTLEPYAAWGAGKLELSNTLDHALIVSPDDTIVDLMRHRDTDGTQLLTNETFERVPADVDTDTNADFVRRSSGQATPGEVTLAVVPEPATFSLLAIGAIGLLARRRRNVVGGAR